MFQPSSTLSFTANSPAGVTNVTVIERRVVAGASSGLSVGIIETQYLDPLAIELLNQPLANQTTPLEACTRLTRHLENYLRSHTEILLD